MFVDRCHHGKEEAELFPQLEVNGSGGITRRREEEHAAGRRLATAYGAAVDAYVPGEASTGARLAAAARAYTDFLRAHIDLEAREVFPAIKEKLCTYDDALVETFERIEVERIGAGTHERLHGMIEGLSERIDPFARPVATGR